MQRNDHKESRPVNSADTSIDFDLILPHMVAANQKQVLRYAAKEIAPRIGIQERILADRLIEKEKQNPSTMGAGIALSHLHISGLNNAVNTFIRLKQGGIDMGAPDNMPVDLICILLTPEREGSSFLRTLARLSRLLRNAQICSKLRAADDDKAIRIIFDQSSATRIAA